MADKNKDQYLLDYATRHGNQIGAGVVPTAATSESMASFERMQAARRNLPPPESAVRIPSRIPPADRVPEEITGAAIPSGSVIGSEYTGDVMASERRFGGGEPVIPEVSKTITPPVPVPALEDTYGIKKAGSTYTLPEGQGTMTIGAETIPGGDEAARQRILREATPGVIPEAGFIPGEPGSRVIGTWKGGAKSAAEVEKEKFGGFEKPVLESDTSIQQRYNAAVQATGGTLPANVKSALFTELHKQAESKYKEDMATFSHIQGLRTSQGEGSPAMIQARAAESAKTAQAENLKLQQQIDQLKLPYEVANIRAQSEERLAAAGANRADINFRIESAKAITAGLNKPIYRAIERKLDFRRQSMQDLLPGSPARIEAENKALQEFDIAMANVGRNEKIIAQIKKNSPEIAPYVSDDTVEGDVIDTPYGKVIFRNGRLEKAS